MATSLEVNVPSLNPTPTGSAFVVSIPASLGQAQSYRCSTLAHAQRFLRLFLKALGARPKNAKAGWPWSR